MSQPLSNIFLAFWNLAVKEPPHVDEVRANLVRNNLLAERAADVPPSTAMRRAADTFRTKETEAKCFTSRTTERVRAQIDDVSEEDGKFRRTFSSLYELDENDRPQHLAGKDLEGFHEAFENASTHYTGSDLSKVIQAILEEDGLGAYSPRKGGGVYFVPVKSEASDLLERIGKFAESVQVRFLTYVVPDTAAQREEIAEAIAQTYTDEVHTHAEAIAAYSKETKSGVVQNRRESLQSTLAQMGRLQNLMNGRYHALATLIGDLSRRLDVIDVDINTHHAEQQRDAENKAQQQRQQGGRRIVATAV